MAALALSMSEINMAMAESSCRYGCRAPSAALSTRQRYCRAAPGSVRWRTQAPRFLTASLWLALVMVDAKKNLATI